MSERIDEQRLTNMRRGLELRNKDFARARQNKEFAAKMLALTKDLATKHQAPVPLPTKAPRKALEEPKREERKAQKKSDAPKQKNARKPEKSSIKESDAFLQQAALLGTKEREATPVDFAAHVPLPLPVINELVDRIYKSTDKIGAQTITIELKNSVLSGAEIQLSVTKGSVRLRFSTDDVKTKRLLKNSQSLITNRLFEKSLLLSDFIVS